MQVNITEYSQTAAALGELRQKYENVVFPVDTTSGMKDAVSARRELRDIRVGLEKMRKDLKEPALRRCQLIDSEAKTITAQLTALEDPIDAQIKAEEQRKEREKQERERIERERVEAIRKKIEGIRALPVALSGEPAAEIAAEIEALEQFTPGEEFAELVGDAATAKSNALDTLRAMHERQVAQEAEAARVAAEQEKLRADREELERMKRELEAAKAAHTESAVKAAVAVEAVASEVVADAVTEESKTHLDETSCAVESNHVSTAEVFAETIPAAPTSHPPIFHRTRIEIQIPGFSVQFALGPANIVLEFDGDTGVLTAAEVL
jgi:hypothetical protein